MFGGIIARISADCNKGFSGNEKLSAKLTDEVFSFSVNTSSTANTVPLPLKGKAFGPIGKSYASIVDDEKIVFSSAG